MNESIVLLTAAICGAVFLTWAAFFSGVASEFGVIIPTKHQMSLYKARNETRKDWLDIIRAIEMAEQLGMDEDVIEQLSEAKVNARAMLDTEEDAIVREKARIADTSKFQRLINKWGTK